MDPLHARYPFLSAAREAVEAKGVDLAAVAEGEAPVVSRAVDRICHAIEEGTVGPEHRSSRVELLSYPLARVLVSLADQPGLTRRYAHAEAETAIARMHADTDNEAELRSLERRRLGLDDLLAEFDLDGDIVEADGAYRVAVATYLRLGGRLSGDRWRLIGRVLADGAVTVNRTELEELLGAAVRSRIEAGLPLDVPDGIAGVLAPAVREIRDRLDEIQLPRKVDAVVPELFPPCVEALLERAKAGETLAPHSRFTLVGFLAATGMDTAEIADHVGDDTEETVQYQVDHLGGPGGAAYPPPSCATMQAYGDCVNQNALCARISHPLEYYRRRLDGDDDVLQASRPESQ